jgi:hypothetical protein
MHNPVGSFGIQDANDYPKCNFSETTTRLPCFCLGGKIWNQIRLKLQRRFDL